LSTTHGRSVARDSNVAARVPIHVGSIWVAVCTTPFVTTAGSVQPIAPVLANWRTRPATAEAIASGVAGWGVSTRIRPVA
jgi:hypothetical protein